MNNRLSQKSDSAFGSFRDVSGFLFRRKGALYKFKPFQTFRVLHGKE
jgi:hypothetical protein